MVLSRAINKILGWRRQRGFIIPHPVGFFGASGPPSYVDEEWVVVSGVVNGTGNAMQYAKVDSGGWTVQSTYSAHGNAFGICSDGKFVFRADGGGACWQYRWSGSAFVRVLDASLGGGGNSVDKVFTFNDGGNHIVAIGQEAFSHGALISSYQTSPTYSYTYRNNYTPANDNWSNCVGFRVDNPYTQEPLDTIVIVGASGQTIRSYTRSGNALTEHGSVTFGNGGRIRGDANTGLLVCSNSGSTSFPMAQLNMTTRALTSLGNSSATASNVRAVCASKGYVICHGTDGTLRSYSHAGATLTFVDSITGMGSDDTSIYMEASPLTGYIYLTSDLSHNSGNGKIFSINDAGELSLLDSSFPIRMGTLSVVHPDYWFLPAALETSAS